MSEPASKSSLRTTPLFGLVPFDAPKVVGIVESGGSSVRRVSTGWPSNLESVGVVLRAVRFAKRSDLSGVDLLVVAPGEALAAAAAAARSRVPLLFAAMERDLPLLPGQLDQLMCSTHALLAVRVDNRVVDWWSPTAR